ncbi:hypothetical protein B0H14DRAFT_3133487 [Mycena olivaceomarginata]|nr:hypothetical protein B0H14DRAFT_3133487 [Mycena olivaceomarginata]
MDIWKSARWRMETVTDVAEGGKEGAEKKGEQGVEMRSAPGEGTDVGGRESEVQGASGVDRSQGKRGSKRLHDKKGKRASVDPKRKAFLREVPGRGRCVVSDRLGDYRAKRGCMERGQSDVQSRAAQDGYLDEKGGGRKTRGGWGGLCAPGGLRDDTQSVRREYWGQIRAGRVRHRVRTGLHGRHARKDRHAPVLIDQHGYAVGWQRVRRYETEEKAGTTEAGDGEASAWHRRERYRAAAPCPELKTAFQSRWASRQEEGDLSVDSEQREECPCDALASPCPFARESGCKRRSLGLAGLVAIRRSLKHIGVFEEFGTCRGVEVVQCFFPNEAQRASIAHIHLCGTCKSNGISEHFTLPSGSCVAVVGNKVDLVQELAGGEGGEAVVTPAQGALRARAHPATQTQTRTRTKQTPTPTTPSRPQNSPHALPRPHPRRPPPSPSSAPPHPHRKTPSYSSQVAFSLGGGLASSLGRSRSHFRIRGSRASTATSTLTAHHTPSSSVGASEHWHSAESSFRDSTSAAQLHGRGHAHAESAPDLHAAAESLSRHAQRSAPAAAANAHATHASLGKGLPTTSLRAGTADSRRVSDAMITPASARISAASSAASSTDRLHPAPAPEAESDSPCAARSNGFPGGWGSVRSAHGWGKAASTSALVDADGNRRSPPPLATGGVTGDAGPSSSALSPLPYPQHFPWGARVLGSFRTVPNSTGDNEPDNRASGAFAPPGAWGSFRQTAAKPKPTTAVASVGAGRSVESLGLGSGAVDLASPVEPAFPAHANGNVVPNGTADPDASARTSMSASTRTRTSRMNGSDSAHSGSTSAAVESPTKWLTEPDIPASGVGAAHFRVSARTGEGVQDVFGWVARRLVEPARNLDSAEDGESGMGMGRDSWAGREGWENSHSRGTAKGKGKGGGTVGQRESHGGGQWGGGAVEGRG